MVCPPSLAATGRYWCRTAHIDATETAFPEKYFSSWGGSLLPTGETQWGTPPYSTASVPSKPFVL